ncbi:AAA family ATPase [Pasteurellaceae bacterium LIM206]|nr:AAA family ATPase [Pasteurellaceae bacterium LIM206]
MNIDLSNENLFIEDEISFDKKNNFIFGKNGCGKSTITRLIKEQQCSNYDVRVFQGFNSIIGENDKLETVVLGEENTDINHQILLKEKEIESIQIEINIIKNNIEKSDAQPNSLWKELQDKENTYQNKFDEIDNFFSKYAKEIKDFEPRITPHSVYNKPDFRKELSKAKQLSDSKFDELLSILKSEIKRATSLSNINIDFSKLLEEVNTLLKSKVEERTHLVRLDGNQDKINFAEKGLRIHKIGDHCAFCNSTISQETILELEKYFSADEVKQLKEDINNKITELDSIKSKYESVNINAHNFYPDFSEKIQQIKEQFSKKRGKIYSFIDLLHSSLKEKQSNLFQESEELAIELPDNCLSDITEYNHYANENNVSDLKEKQENAKSELRYHFIYKYCNEFNYSIKDNELKNSENALNEVKEKIKQEEGKLENHSNEISKIKQDIQELQAKTRNEKILVDRINKKLKLYASFELIHQEESNDYKIKCLRTSLIRNVTELSTGEKNIIAFLYFIEKLNEYTENLNSRNRCIVFDDPMTSNDDTVQYLIIEELQNLRRKIQDSERIIILTHNIHFYLNVKYGIKYNKGEFYRLTSINNKTNIKHVENEKDDFNTSYGSLWKELKELSENNSIDACFLLNPIRRIIETYTKFNNIQQTDFFKDTPGAMKLFNVNSHSIDDLEADLNGKTKQNIINIMKECFEKNNALEHYNKYLGNESGTL